MYEALLDHFARWRAKYGRTLPPPATEGELASLRADAQARLGHPIPPEYERFLRRTNGLGANGLFIYATERSPIAGTADAFIDGFVDANLDWWDLAPNREFLFFGDSGQETYVREIAKGAYQVRDRPSHSLIKEVASFDALLFEALEANKPPR